MGADGGGGSSGASRAVIKERLRETFYGSFFSTVFLS
jgi:hypothetical protein